MVQNDSNGKPDGPDKTDMKKSLNALDVAFKMKPQLRLVVSNNYPESRKHLKTKQFYIFFSFIYMYSLQSKTAIFFQ